MQPDYSTLWRNLNAHAQTEETQFYTFFEDSLNQFISTNSGSEQPLTINNSEFSSADIKNKQ